jgi:hypothetical protein
MSNNNREPLTTELASTENFEAWKAEEPDEETTFYLQLGRATINFFEEEWQDFLGVVEDLDSVAPNEEGLYMLEFDNIDVWMDEEDWVEFKELVHHLRK